MKISHIIARIISIYNISCTAAAYLKRHMNATKVLEPDGEEPKQLSHVGRVDKSALVADSDAVDTENQEENLFAQSVRNIDEDITDGEKCEIMNIYNPLQSIKGLEYLGCGYDNTKSVPFGDEESFLNMGYTQPVIQFQWPCGNHIKSKPVPLGVWVRQEPACHRGHEKRKINSDESLASIMTEDVVSFLGIANLGVNATKQAKEIIGQSNIAKKSRFALKTNCALFTTGMILSSELNVTRAFNNAAKVLVAFPDKEKCTEVNDYRKDGSCADYYDLWKQFFTSYGTHVISRLTMGGKILQLDDSSETKLDSAKSKAQEQNVSVNLSIIKAKYGNKKTDESEQNETLKNRSSKFFIMGGETYIPVDTDDGFQRWVETIKDNSMPINIELTPMTRFLPKEIRRDYWLALAIYNTR
ncbi:MAC Perforin domain containing protein, putative [Babesia ovis]|uniref:MAC Perforin domain containing protein, putative n=1 Tax=Babesia ovis TaxID=5869 RepID=A0A9W5T8B5_BABOV|nr:MAC Perforin domain containing protein, putative [Babesia ovis]